MDITPLYPRVIGWDVHQAEINACAIAEQADAPVTVEHREFGAFQRDRRALLAVDNESGLGFGGHGWAPGTGALLSTTDYNQSLLFFRTCS